MKLRHKRSALATLLLVPLLFLLGGCAVLRGEQPKIDPFEPSAAFDFFQSARPISDTIVAQQAEPAEDPDWLRTGQQDGQVVVTMPISVTEAFLLRGQEQYDIYCAPCHGLGGFGKAVVVQRGFPEPPNFHTIRLREAPDGYYFDVITNGFGQMFSYAPQIEPGDRWAIIAYIRALQLSQHMPDDLLTAEELEQIQGQQE